MPVIPALKRQREEDHHEFEVRLAPYIVPGRPRLRTEICLKNKKRTDNNKIELHKIYTNQGNPCINEHICSYVLGVLRDSSAISGLHTCRQGAPK